MRNQAYRILSLSVGPLLNAEEKRPAFLDDDDDDDDDNDDDDDDMFPAVSVLSS